MDKVSLDRLVLSGPLIFQEGWAQDVPGHDSSDDWYIIAEGGPKQKCRLTYMKFVLVQ
jgi:hypothetical protein